MFDIGGGELMLIILVVLVAFGPKKLPELAQSLGRGIREFKRAQRDFTDQINSAIEIENRRKTKTVSRDAPTSIPQMTSGDVPMPSLRPPVQEPAVPAPVEVPAAPAATNETQTPGTPQ